VGIASLPAQCTCCAAPLRGRVMQHCVDKCGGSRPPCAFSFNWHASPQVSRAVARCPWEQEAYLVLRIVGRVSCLMRRAPSLSYAPSMQAESSAAIVHRACRLLKFVNKASTGVSLDVMMSPWTSWQKPELARSPPASLKFSKLLQMLFSRPKCTSSLTSREQVLSNAISHVHRLCRDMSICALGCPPVYPSTLC